MSKKPQTEGYLDVIGRSGGKASVEVREHRRRRPTTSTEEAPDGLMAETPTLQDPKVTVKVNTVRVDTMADQEPVIGEVLKLLREIAGRLDGLGEGQEQLYRSLESLRKRSNENTEMLLLAVRGVGSDVTQIELRLASILERGFGERAGLGN